MGIVFNVLSNYNRKDTSILYKDASFLISVFKLWNKFIKKVFGYFQKIFRGEREVTESEFSGSYIAYAL
jgi:hypothetical protein